MLLDLHTHRPAPYPQGIIALRAGTADAERMVADFPQQLFSIGIHPWDIPLIDIDSALQSVARLALQPNVVAIGETGVDILKGGPMYKQLNAMKAQLDLSERLGKPLIVHDVKAHDIIVGLRRDLTPTQRWVIHGFYNKAPVATMLLKAGCDISFGTRYNPEAVAAVPLERMFAETDDAETDILTVIGELSAVRGEDLTDRLAANLAALIDKPGA